VPCSSVFWVESVKLPLDSHDIYMTVCKRAAAVVHILARNHLHSAGLCSAQLALGTRGMPQVMQRRAIECIHMVWKCSSWLQAGYVNLYIMAPARAAPPEAMSPVLSAERPGLVVLVIELETALAKTPGVNAPCKLTSPYRAPLTKFLNKHAKEAVAYFLDPSRLHVRKLLRWRDHRLHVMSLCAGMQSCLYAHKE